MAVAKSARVVSAAQVSPGTCMVELEVDEPLGFAGGQYIIVDSGQLLPSGKAAKRAYSILTSDADQRRFRLAVKRIPDGLVSAFMHGLSPGATVSFSGPWGKLGPELCTVCAPALADGAVSADEARGPGQATARDGRGDAEPARACAACTAGATLVIATDTGISAALGLVQARRMQPRLRATALLWLQPPGESFLPEAIVRSQLPAGLTAVRFAALPPINHPERVPHMRTVLFGEMLRAREHGGVARAYISGDGAVNYALLDELVAAGVPATRDSVESFFNMPKKSA